MDTKPALTGCCVCSNSSLVLFQKPNSQLPLEVLLPSHGCLLKEGEIPSSQQVQAFLSFVQNLNLQHSGLTVLRPCQGPGSPWTAHLGQSIAWIQGAASPKPGPRRCYATSTKLDWLSHHRAAPAPLCSCSLKGAWQTKTLPGKKTSLSSSLLLLGSMPAHIPLCFPGHTDNSSLPLIMQKSQASGSQRKAQTHMAFLVLKVFCKAWKTFETIRRDSNRQD